MEKQVAVEDEKAGGNRRWEGGLEGELEGRGKVDMHT
jgi:hypothetical protein